MVSDTLREKFWELPLDKLNDLEWESLCDGCGRGCLKKFIDEKSDQLYWTRVACRNFSNESGRCQCYEKRSEVVPDCINVKEMMSISLNWMPPSCAYRLRANEQPLFDWHPLISENNKSVIESGASIIDKSLSEENVHPDGYWEHVIRWVDN